MREDDAINILKDVMLGMQKYRSISFDHCETIEEQNVVEWLNAGFQPFVFGPKCFLLPLSNLIDRLNNGESLVPMDFYNFMCLVDFMEEYGRRAVCWKMKSDPPRPNVKWLSDGWTV